MEHTLSLLLNCSERTKGVATGTMQGLREAMLPPPAHHDQIVAHRIRTIPLIKHEHVFNYDRLC